jgi:RNA polymerase-binding transcription factor DksA
MKKSRKSTPSQPRERHDLPVVRAKSAIPAKWQPYYRKLQEARDSLLSQNRALLHEAREPVGTSGSHVAESGTDEFERGLHFSLLATEQTALHEVEAALRRIESGTFGICEISGKRIPVARLKVVPWTRYTAKVEGERENAPRVVAPTARTASDKAKSKPLPPANNGRKPARKRGTGK